MSEKEKKWLSWTVKKKIPAFTLQLFFALVIFSILSCGGGRMQDESIQQREKQYGTTPKIKIGAIIPLSGQLAGFGETFEKALKLAVDEINSQGGVLGQQIGLSTCDDGTTPEGAKNCFDKLTGEGIKFIIGPATSSGVINGVCGGAQNKVCTPVKEKKVLVVSPSATSPLISELDDGGFVWRTPPSDAFQGEALADYIKQDQSLTRVAVIFRDDPYGRGLATAFKSRFEKLGGNVLAFVSYPEDKEKDFTQEINALYENGNPEGIVLITFVSDGNNLLVELRNYITANQLQKPKLFGVDGNKDKDISGGPAADFIKGNMWGTAPTPPKQDEDYGKFSQAYKEKWGSDPAIFNDNAYDAVYVIAIGIESAGEYNPEKAKEKLVELTNGGEQVKPVSAGGSWSDIVQKIKEGVDIDYKGVSGKLDFDQNGDVKSGYYIIWQITDTKGEESDFAEVKTIAVGQ